MVLKKKNKESKKILSHFVFKAKLWKHKGPAGWYFLTVPQTTSSKIRKVYLSSEEGWGRLKTTASLGASKWQTAVWFDTKVGSYLLPVRSEVRKKEKLNLDQSATCSLEFEIDQWTRNSFS